MFNAIDSIISEQINKGKKNFAIYPFGKNGVTTKEILNARYGVQELLIVDNELCKINPNIVGLEQVDNYENYTWLITCSNPTIYREIEKTVNGLIPEENIVYLFKAKAGYGEEFKRLKNIGKEGNEAVSTPCKEFLEIIKKKKLEAKKISIAEIGVCHGATAVEACKLLDDKDTYYCLDYENIVEELVYDLNLVPEVKCQIIGKGNSRKIFDSYNWNLCDMLFQMRNRNMDGIFDVVYLDGAHTFLHDGLACCLLKELIKKDGFIIFDDMCWSYSSSKGMNPNSNPQIKEWFTNEQIEDCQVRRVVNAFMIHDTRFQEIFMSETFIPSEAVYKRII